MGHKPVIGPALALTVNLDERAARHTIRECMERSGANQTQFARAMGVTQPALSYWLSGKHEPFPMAIRAAYFAAISLGVPVRIPKPGQLL